MSTNQCHGLVKVDSSFECYNTGYILSNKPLYSSRVSIVCRFKIELFQFKFKYILLKPVI